MVSDTRWARFRQRTGHLPTHEEDSAPDEPGAEHADPASPLPALANRPAPPPAGVHVPSAAVCKADRGRGRLPGAKDGQLRRGGEEGEEEGGGEGQVGEEAARACACRELGEADRWRRRLGGCAPSLGCRRGEQEDEEGEGEEEESEERGDEEGEVERPEDRGLED